MQRGFVIILLVAVAGSLVIAGFGITYTMNQQSSPGNQGPKPQIIIGNNYTDFFLCARVYQQSFRVPTNGSATTLDLVQIKMRVGTNVKGIQAPPSIGIYIRDAADPGGYGQVSALGSPNYFVETNIAYSTFTASSWFVLNGIVVTLNTNKEYTLLISAATYPFALGMGGNSNRYANGVLSVVGSSATKDGTISYAYTPFNSYWYFPGGSSSGADQSSNIAADITDMTFQLGFNATA